MSRNITISTDVYAAIWARRKDGQENEDSILRGILGIPAQKKLNKTMVDSKIGGIHDTRNNAYFPEGLTIFREYKKNKYYAVVQNGRWVRKDDGSAYLSLNQLNGSIVAGSENVWGSWKYKNEDGKVYSINKFRK